MRWRGRRRARRLHHVQDAAAVLHDWGKPGSFPFYRLTAHDAGFVFETLNLGGGDKYAPRNDQGANSALADNPANRFGVEMPPLCQLRGRVEHRGILLMGAGIWGGDGHADRRLSCIVHFCPIGDSPLPHANGGGFKTRDAASASWLCGQGEIYRHKIASFGGWKGRLVLRCLDGTRSVRCGPWGRASAIVTFAHKFVRDCRADAVVGHVGAKARAPRSMSGVNDYLISEIKTNLKTSTTNRALLTAAFLSDFHNR